MIEPPWGRRLKRAIKLIKQLHCNITTSMHTLPGIAYFRGAIASTVWQKRDLKAMDFKGILIVNLGYGKIPSFFTQSGQDFPDGSPHGQRQIPHTPF
ncbi:hypothetical protein FA04_10280 [Ensifer adhaerens]|nr:hypothetical protein FA04_10280 [Ensifer adhaerens]